MLNPHGTCTTVSFLTRIPINGSLANLEKNAVAKDQDSDASSDDFNFGDGNYTNLGGAEGGNNHEFGDTEENEQLEGFLQENVSFVHSK